MYFQPATMHFNEENLSGIIMQPFNTWTNLAFIAVSLLIFLIYGKTDIGKKIMLIPVAGIFIGISSFIYHAQFYFFFQVFDLSSMFLLASFLFSYNLLRLNIIKGISYHICFFLLFMLLIAILLIIRDKIGELIFGGVLIISIILEMVNFFMNKNTSYKNYIVAIVIFIVSYVIWQFDCRHIFIKPENHFFQGHGMWHILNAVSIFFLYVFYRQFEQTDVINR
jgi:hypothetical protein